jgi:hypothetical protein
VDARKPEQEPDPEGVREPELELELEPEPESGDATALGPGRRDEPVTDVPTVAVAFKTATLALGGLITYLAAKAARRTGSTGLASLAVGFGVVTLGSLLAGVTDLFVPASAGTALVVESALTTLGFAVVAYSLYVTRRAG